MAQRVARSAHHVVAWLLVIGLVVEVFLAGLAVFSDAAIFATHREWGHLLEAFPVVLLVAAAVGRLGRWHLVAPLVIFGLLLMQSVLVVLRESAPFVAALHPVNAFLIIFIAVQVARKAWVGSKVDETPPPPAAPLESESPGS